MVEVAVQRCSTSPPTLASSVEHPTSSPTIKVATISSLQYIFGTTPSNYPQKFERCPSISCTRLNTNLVLLDESQYAVIHCSLDKSRPTSQLLIQCFRGSIVKVPPSYFCWPCLWQTATAIVSCTLLLYSRWEEMCLVPTGRGVSSSVLRLVQGVYCGKCVVWQTPCKISRHSELEWNIVRNELFAR